MTTSWKGCTSTRRGKVALVFIVLAILAVQLSCRRPVENLNRRDILVAGASNLSNAMEELARRFEELHGSHVVTTYAATGDLARQIEQGAPFDVFAAADTKHVEDLKAKGFIDPESVKVYAKGRLVLTWSGAAAPSSLEDLASSSIRRIGLPRPEIAPYGAAAEEALKRSGLWEKVQPKIVYAENVSQSRQYSVTGNVDAAFIPLSLIRPGERYLEISPSLFSPIEQAIGVVSSSKAKLMAQEFIDFIVGSEGHAILARSGY